jgi:rod shape-determining protein MreD
MFSIRLRTRLWHLGLAASVVIFIWLFQINVLTRLTLGGLLCNLPLTFTIVWASIFGSRLPRLTADDLRTLTMSEILSYQALSGSLSGALIGALFGALFASVTPIYPFGYPLIGWIAGYFSLKRINHAQFLIVPLVLFASVLAGSFMALQLTLMGRPEVLPRFIQAVLPEAVMNALVAPWIFLPMQRWNEFWATREVAEVQ